MKFEYAKEKVKTSRKHLLLIYFPLMADVIGIKTGILGRQCLSETIQAHTVTPSTNQPVTHTLL